jgi:hypothetical protein
MNVIAHRVNLDERRVMIFEHTGQVGMNLSSFLVAQKWSAIFGAEYEMNNDVRE